MIKTGANISLTTDTTEVQQMFNYFTGKDWKRIEENALRTAGRKLRKYNRDRMKSMFPASNRKSKSGYTKKLIDAIIATKVRIYGKQLRMKVHTMGISNKKGDNSGTFRARFFNNSEETVRHLQPYKDKLGRNYKSGRNVGFVKRIPYFDENRQQVEKDINSYLADQILKLNKKKYLK